MQIEELLLEHSPTILFVGHDSEFCKHIATKIVELKEKNHFQEDESDED